MRIKCPIIIGLLLSATAGFAQQAPGLYHSRLSPEVQTILAQQAAAVQNGAKTSAASQHLIAYSQTYPGIITDSFVYAYSGLRGSDKILTALIPVTSFSINGDAFCNADTQTRYTTPQSQPNAPLVYRYRDYFTYDAADRIITATQYGGTTFYRFNYTYNAAGNATQVLKLGSATINGTYTPASIEFFQYNAQDKLVYDSLGGLPSGVPNVKMLSYYDATSRLTSSGRYLWNAAGNAWQLRDSMIYTYYSNNLLRTSARIQYSSSLICNRDSFGYSGSNPLPVYTLSSNSASATGPWAPVSQEVNVLNAAGDNYITRLLSNYTGGIFVPYIKTYGFFYTDGSIRRGESYYFTTGSQDAVPNYVLNYYYQQSGNPAAVAAGSAGTVLVIYPNPAGDYIILDCSGLQKQSAVPYRVDISDAGGRQVATRLFDAGGEVHVDISSLPAGWYSINVRTASGEVVKAASFVKR